MATIPNSKPEINCTQIFIGNEFVNSVSGKTFPTINPVNEEKIADIQEGDKADIDKAVASAKQAFQRNSAWRRMDASARGHLLYKLADAIEKNITEIASVETLDNGKPFQSAVDDIRGAISVCRYYAGLADKSSGQTIPADGKVFCYSRVEPVGVVGAIIPWNFPLFLFVFKIAPALAAGCTVVVKPAEQTPLTALIAANLIKTLGFPPGVVNVVPGYGATAGAALANHPDIDKISFTGSSEVGKIILQTAGKTNLKRVTLELGGKSPNIIFPDVDVSKVAEAAHEAIMHNMGQVCCAGSRTFVHEDIYDEFVRLSVERAKNRKVGNPLDGNVEQGPQIDETQMKKILDLIQSGVKQGANLLCGGKRIGDKGYFIEPTVFADIKSDMRIAREEIFGPVQCIFKFKSIDEVIDYANDTHYGLAAGVFTKDLTTALTVADGLQAGTVWVNTYNYGTPQAPFGGYKMSGHGREGGTYGIEIYQEIKTVYVNLL